MINRYSDHAANERTFLAWIRTAIAVMAFGFLVEKFNLFLEVASRTLAGRQPSVFGQVVAGFAGLLLIVLGGAMIVVATIRYRQIGRDIDSDQERKARGSRLDVALVVLLLGLGGTLFAYLLYTVFSGM